LVRISRVKHAETHESGGNDEINLSGLSGQQIFVPYNGKIADISKTDTNKYYLTLANSAGTGAITGETRKIIAVLIGANRMAGTGSFYVYPNEGQSIVVVNYPWSGAFYIHYIVVKDGTQRLQYSQSVANDDFDLYCFGYVVEA
jgi:hypothetical protein